MEFIRLLSGRKGRANMVVETHNVIFQKKVHKYVL
jgi:hypothetical protein